MSRGIVLFLEGDTEEEFYRKLIAQLHSYTPKNKFEIDKVVVRNLKGIGNYKNRAKRVFINDIQSINPNINFTVIICYDTDVFDYSTKPPIVWCDVEKALTECGAEKVIHVKAKFSIENWFLYDKESVLKYLGLPNKTDCIKGNGVKVLEALFKKAGKAYIKGRLSKGFIETLNLQKIMPNICPEIKGLCKELGIKCKGEICK